MSEFTVQSESIDVEQIMEQIRSRIKEKRGEDYTEAQIRELAGVKLERFLAPGDVRSDLVEHYRRQHTGSQTKLAFPETLQTPPPAPESYDFDPDIIYRSSRGVPGKLLYGIRKLLSPLLKFFINVGPIVHALHVQRQINERQNEAINWMVQTQAEFIDRVTKLFDVSSSRLAAREEIDALNYEVMNNLVVEMTRLSIEMKNHRMRVESVAGRLDFDERRARALEGVVQYRDQPRGASAAQTRGASAAQTRGASAAQTRGASAAQTREASAAQTGGAPPPTEDGAPKRRRRRRGRRRPARADAATPETVGASGEAEAAEPSPSDTPERGETAPEPAASENRQVSAPTTATANDVDRKGPPAPPAADESEPPKQ